MKENIQIVLVAFVVACLFFFLLQSANLGAQALTVSMIVFFGTALLQLALKIKRLLENR
jgi:hypothetical protein